MQIYVTKIDGERAVIDLDLLDVYSIARHAREAAAVYEQEGRAQLGVEARQVDELFTRVAELIRANVTFEAVSA